MKAFKKKKKKKRAYDYYSSFTVTIRGTDINPDLLLESDVFPNNIKVFLNRNNTKVSRMFVAANPAVKPQNTIRIEHINAQ